MPTSRPTWFRVFLGTTLLLALTVALIGIGCYKGNPPCNPGTVDWPQCDPTQPPWGTGAAGHRG